MAATTTLNKNNHYATITTLDRNVLKHVVASQSRSSKLFHSTQPRSSIQENVAQGTSSTTANASAASSSSQTHNQYKSIPNIHFLSSNNQEHGIRSSKCKEKLLVVYVEKSLGRLVPFRILEAIAFRRFLKICSIYYLFQGS